MGKWTILIRESKENLQNCDTELIINTIKFLPVQCTLQAASTILMLKKYPRNIIINISVY